MGKIVPNRLQRDFTAIAYSLAKRPVDTMPDKAFTRLSPGDAPRLELAPVLQSMSGKGNGSQPC